MQIEWKLWPTTLLCSIAIQAVLGSVLSLNEAARGMLKPPYLLFIASTLAFAAISAAVRQRNALVLIAFWCMALSALWISYHWGGAVALRPAGFVVALALVLIAINVRTNLWRIERSSVALAASAAIVLALMIPFSASYYAVERFGTSHSDLDGRIRHWMQVLSMMDGDLQTQALGMGLGKFPVTYRWRNPQGELPASMRYLDENSHDETDHETNNRYLRLFAPQYPAGYGEVLRLLQRLPVRPDTDYLLTFDARRQDERSGLNIAMCERLLLYPKNCLPVPPFVLPPGPEWQHQRLRLASSTLGAGSWLMRAPTQIAIAVGGDHGFIDVDNISLREETTGVELLRNGTFSNGNDGWFFSSDHYHLPWHAQSLTLNLYFELGWLGTLSFFSLLLCTIIHLLLQAGRGSIRAASCLAALAGFQIVGLFDSLLDVPRLALLFYLVLLASLMLPARPWPRQLRKSPP
jgi:hypothetical protein